ncbi:hypothetical protein BDZ91DRAFT_664316 [Kalaharituber pfeilii]|nr:hypothetical protein BDZ91DRAFT_664316 [Kalaharituber pfeilii]
MWHPAVYGFNGDPAKMIEPLHSMPFSRWWFHGELNNPPRNNAKVTLPAGGKVTVELACGKQHTSFGGAKPDMNEPCPTDRPAAHAGPNVDPKMLRGCGLAIAYKSDAKQVKPEDFVVFSVNHKCVKNRKTVFNVPKLPKCPNGKCICAWFWQGQVSNDEMYMNGFDCNVTNPGRRGLKRPAPARYCGGNPQSCVKGAKQPLYWANERPNIAYHGRDKLPAYQNSWGFKDGAQNDIFK